MKVSLTVDGIAYEATVDHKARIVLVDGASFPLRATGVALLRPGRANVLGRDVAYSIESVDLLAGEGGQAATGPTRVKPPMTGKLDAIKVTVGQSVAKGDVLFVLEAMKMQNEVRAPAAGKVTAIHVKAGVNVEPSQVVLELAS